MKQPPNRDTWYCAKYFLRVITPRDTRKAKTRQTRHIRHLSLPAGGSVTVVAAAYFVVSTVYFRPQYRNAAHCMARVGPTPGKFLFPTSLENGQAPM